MRNVLCIILLACTFPADLGATETPQPSAPQLAIVTFGPGTLSWERFGHNAIVVDDPEAGTRLTYNYGVFDFLEQNFLLNFALGHMHYSLAARELDEDLAVYLGEGRSVTVQVLNLTPAQARHLAAFLAWNAQPKNAGYRYDYFLNNCSTRVRDALNQALGGALERQLAGRAAPRSYRSDAVRLISADFWSAVGMDMGLGPKADGPLSLWQESFVPMVLSASLRNVVVTDASGRALPLVSDEQVVSTGELPAPPAAPPELRLPFLAAGIGLGALLLGLARGAGRLYRVSFGLLAVAWWLICGLSGLVLAGLWGLTDHWAAWDNENLLLFDPLCLLLPVMWWRTPQLTRGLATLIAVAALLTLIIRALPGLYQDNLAFIALAVPVHLVLAVLAWRRRSLVGAPPTGLSRMSQEGRSPMEAVQCGCGHSARTAPCLMSRYV